MKAKIIGRHTFSVRVYKSVKFARVLDNLRNVYNSATPPAHLVIPYVMTCAAALESRLNDAFQDYAIRKWKGDYSAISESYLSMSFRGKLNLLVPTLTENQYQMNRNHFVYLRLASLIRVRNELVHAKSTSEDVKVHLGEDDYQFPFPLTSPRAISVKLAEMGDDVTLGAAQAFSPLEYHEALEKLERWFFRRYPDKLKKVALLVPSVGDA